MPCHECGHTSGPDATFCTRCGAQLPVVFTAPAPPPVVHAPVGGPPRRSGNAPLIAILVGVLALGAAAVVIVVSGGGKEPGSATGTYPVAAPSSPAVTTPEAASAAPTYPTTEDTTAPSDPQDAKAELEAIADRDQPAVDLLAGSWVPQLSAKKPGLVADGITYDYPAILRNYLDLRAKYADVLLLRSGDFTSFKFDNFWITVHNQSYSDGQSANSLCDGESIPTDDCYAKLLSHSR